MFDYPDLDEYAQEQIREYRTAFDAGFAFLDEAPLTFIDTHY